MIGGTRLAGGEGNVGRTALGVVFLSVLNSGLSSLGLSDSAYELYRGIALLTVLTVQVVVRRLTDVEERRLAHARAAGSAYGMTTFERPRASPGAS